MSVNKTRQVAIVNFRTLPNGSYKWMKNLTRGWWRVSIVHDETGSLSNRSNNVIRTIYDGPDGLHGVTPRLRYYIGDSAAEARIIADKFNKEHLNECQTLTSDKTNECQTKLNNV